MIPDYMFPFANHLWQSTLFAMAVWLLILTLRKNRAAVRHRLWLTASVKFLVPFSLLGGIGGHFQWQTPSVTRSVPASMIVETISRPFSAPDAVTSGVVTPARANRLPAVLIGVWICGAVASLSWWFILWWRVRRILRLSAPANLNTSLRAMYGPERFEPGVFGIFRPVLLLPEGIAHHLTAAQLDSVVAHELCHVRRRDNLAMTIHMAAEALFWFHPLIWFIRVRLSDEQERACDEEVIRSGAEPVVYAEALLKVCAFYMGSPLTCVSGVAGSDLKKRVRRIMRKQIGEKLDGWRKLTLAAAGVAALAAPVLVGMLNASPQNHARPASTPKWEAVSIRPCGPSPLLEGQRGSGPPFRFTPDRMSLRCMNVKSLIRSAYKTYLDDATIPGIQGKDDVLAAGTLDDLPGLLSTTPIVGGPAWIGSEHYLVEAKAEGITNRGIMQGPMLQIILENRFQLKVHWENREVPIYALTVAQGGPKLKRGSCTPRPPWPDLDDLTGPPLSLPQLPPGQKYCAWAGGVDRNADMPHVALEVEGVTIDQFLKVWLKQVEGKQIVDRTGLSGKFDIHLEFAMPEEDRQRFAQTTGRSLGEVPTAPSIFTALQEQLGLKLEPAKAPVEHLVIDSIERPSPN